VVQKEPVAAGKESKVRMPEGLWIKCDGCKEILSKPELEQNLNVCPRCQHHFRIGARARLDLLVDPTASRNGMRGSDPWTAGIQGPEELRGTSHDARKSTGMEECLLSGTATIGGFPVSLSVMEFEFMGGAWVGRGGKSDASRRASRRRARSIHCRDLFGRRADAGERPLADADGQDERGPGPLAKAGLP